jgi:hypothetical protein
LLVLYLILKRALLIFIIRHGFTSGSQGDL